MPEQLPTWLNAGVEPPESLKTNGWQPGMKPSAQHMNWLFNRAYAVLKELQDGGNLEEIEQKVTTLEKDFAAHKADMAKHNQFIQDGKLHQLTLGYNPTLNCATWSISEVVE